jgi:hypothetical protein
MTQSARREERKQNANQPRVLEAITMLSKCLQFIHRRRVWRRRGRRGFVLDGNDGERCRWKRRVLRGLEVTRGVWLNLWGRGEVSRWISWRFSMKIQHKIDQNLQQVHETLKLFRPSTISYCFPRTKPQSLTHQIIWSSPSTFKSNQNNFNSVEFPQLFAL